MAVKEKVQATTPWRTLDGQILEVVINPGMTVKEQYEMACRIVRQYQYSQWQLQRTVAGLSSEFFKRYAYRDERPDSFGSRPWIRRQLERQEKLYALVGVWPKSWVKVRRIASTDPLRIYEYLSGMDDLREALKGHDFDDDSDQIWTGKQAMEYFNCSEFKRLARFEEK